MALTYINGGGIRIDGETPAFAVIEYEDGLSSDIPDAPPALTPEEEKIEEQAEEEQKQEEEKKDAVSHRPSVRLPLVGVSVR